MLSKILAKGLKLGTDAENAYRPGIEYYRGFKLTYIPCLFSDNGGYGSGILEPVSDSAVYAWDRRHDTDFIAQFKEFKSAEDFIAHAKDFVDSTLLCQH